MATSGFRRWPPISKLDLLSDAQRIIDLDTEIANCVLKFRVSDRIWTVRGLTVSP
jgi:hypothetical protein